VRENAQAGPIRQTDVDEECVPALGPAVKDARGVTTGADELRAAAP